MNILFVSQLLPWPLDNGTSIRVYHLLQWLSERHRVTLATLVEEWKTADESFPLWNRLEQVIPVPRLSCAFNRTRRFEHHPALSERLKALAGSLAPSLVRRWYSPELVTVLQRLRATNGFDLVWAERTYMAEMVHLAGFRRVIVDVDDIESVAFFRVLRQAPRYLSKPLHYAEWAKGHLYERVLLPLRYERLLVCKEEDRRFFVPGMRHKVFVVPNGVRSFPPSDPAAEVPGEMLFVGSLEYPPNIDAMTYFVQEILPRVQARHPGARLSIVGVRPREAALRLHNGSDVVVAGSVPDLEPYYRKAALVVVPMRLGGGTRIKVLEALAHGKALITTSVGAEGLGLPAGEALEIADGPQAFADVCARLLADPAARRRLGQTGRAQVLAQYDWEAVLDQRLAKVLAL